MDVRYLKLPILASCFCVYAACSVTLQHPFWVPSPAWQDGGTPNPTLTDVDKHRSLYPLTFFSNHRAFTQVSKLGWMIQHGVFDLKHRQQMLTACLCRNNRSFPRPRPLECSHGRRKTRGQPPKLEDSNATAFSSGFIWFRADRHLCQSIKNTISPIYTWPFASDSDGLARLMVVEEV